MPHLNMSAYWTHITPVFRPYKRALPFGETYLSTSITGSPGAQASYFGHIYFESYL